MASERLNPHARHRLRAGPAGPAARGNLPADRVRWLGGRAFSVQPELTSTYFSVYTKAGRTEGLNLPSGPNHATLLGSHHMAIHHPTPPLGGGERPRLPSAQVGPVTQAIRAMRAPTWHLHGSRQLGDNLPHGARALSRDEVENLVGDLIDLLDAMDGDNVRSSGMSAPANRRGFLRRPARSPPRSAAAWPSSAHLRRRRAPSRPRCFDSYDAWLFYERRYLRFQRYTGCRQGSRIRTAASSSWIRSRGSASIGSPSITLVAPFTTSTPTRRIEPPSS